MTNTKFTWWQWLAIVAGTGLSLGVLPILAYRGRFDGFTGPTAREIIDAASVVVSWPVAAALIAFRFMARFHAALEAYLRNIGRIKLPGGVELQSAQSPSTPDAEPRIPPGSLVLSADEQAQVAGFISNLERDRNLSVEQKAAVEQQVEWISGVAIEWKFRFLSHFFVERTRHVLYWFSTASPQTKASYHALWTPVIVEEEQRTIILDLLLHFGLVTEADGVLRIAQHGYSFLQFIGLVPPTPTAG